MLIARRNNRGRCRIWNFILIQNLHMPDVPFALKILKNGFCAKNPKILDSNCLHWFQITKIRIYKIVKLASDGCYCVTHKTVQNRHRLLTTRTRSKSNNFEESEGMGFWKKGIIFLFETSQVMRAMVQVTIFAWWINFWSIFSEPWKNAFSRINTFQARV